MTKKLKSSSIYYALYLSIVMAILLGSMVLFSGINRRFTTMLEIEETLRNNAVSGIEMGLANFAELPTNQPTAMRLFGEGIDSVILEKKQWGAFTILQSTSLHQQSTQTKIAMAGQINQTDELNLYVCDQGRPIAVCGDVRIEGRVAIPETGIKRAYIEGKNYTGDKMIYGQQIPSGRNLPPINEELISDLFTMSATVETWDPQTDSLEVSFSEQAVHFISDNYVSINNATIKGQILIEARDSIFVSATSNLEDVILKSPVIHFEEGFKGNLQAFASKRVTISSGVLLKYPSVVGLIEEEFPTTEFASIELKEQSQLIGSVFLWSKAPNFRLPVQLKIAPEAIFDGFAYNTGNTQLQGTINGHLYTEKFYLKTPASTYENHLLDGKILNQLPQDFIYVNLLKSTQQLHRIQWLN